MSNLVEPTFSLDTLALLVSLEFDLLRAAPSLSWTTAIAVVAVHNDLLSSTSAYTIVGSARCFL